MYLNILVAVISGIFLGTMTGLTPGIHINLIASIIVAYSYKILELLDPITISITIIAMAITHTIFDIIPSTLLGIPNTENLTMLLPAHALTTKGKAKQAIDYGLIGSAIGIFTTIALSPLIIKIIPTIYDKIKDYIVLIIISIATYTIIKSKNKFLSLVFFLSSGILGIVSFNIKTVNQPLLPLLSGLFGLSAIILSLKEKVKISEQEEKTEINIDKKTLGKYSITTSIASFLTNFLPGLTSSHTAMLSNKISKVKDKNDYIILSNATNASAVVISLIAFYTIDKTRSGAIATIQYLISSINLDLVIMLMAISLITTSICIFLSRRFSKRIIKNINKIDYSKINLFIISLIIILVLLITKLEGIIILITSASIGILAQKLDVERINLTGCLIFPIILYLI